MIHDLDSSLRESETYSVFISKSYFPKELQSTKPGKEDFEQWTVRASSRDDAAKKVWAKHRNRLLKLMGPQKTKLPRKVSLYVSMPGKGSGSAPGRHDPILVEGESKMFDALDESAKQHPGLTRYKGTCQLVYIGKHGWFHAYSAMPVKNAPTTVFTLDQYKAGVKDGSLKPDPVVDDFDIPRYLKKISKAMAGLKLPKAEGCVIYAAYKSGSKGGASGWVYIADGKAMKTKAAVQLNRYPSKTATSKYKAWGSPRSPHTHIHEFAHLIWYTMSAAQKQVVIDWFNEKVKPDAKAAMAAKIAPTDYACTKATEYFPEIIGYSLYGTKRLDQSVLDFIKSLSSHSGGGGKPPVSKDAASTPSASGSPSAPQTSTPPPPENPEKHKEAPGKGDPYMALKAAGLVKGPAKASYPWAVVYLKIGSGKTWRDKVRSILKELGGKPAGSRHKSGGSPSIWTVNGKLYYVNHKHGVAQAKPGLKLSDLQESLNEAMGYTGSLV